MSESKIDATDRMRREGRLEAFNLRRDEIRTELKGAGKKRQATGVSSESESQDAR